MFTFNRRLEAHVETLNSFTNKKTNRMQNNNNIRKQKSPVKKQTSTNSHFSLQEKTKKNSSIFPLTSTFNINSLMLSTAIYSVTLIPYSFIEWCYLYGSYDYLISFHSPYLITSQIEQKQMLQTHW